MQSPSNFFELFYTYTHVQSLVAFFHRSLAQELPSSLSRKHGASFAPRLNGGNSRCENLRPVETRNPSHDDRKDEERGEHSVVYSLVQSFLRLIVATLIAGIGCKLAVAQMEMAMVTHD